MLGPLSPPSALKFLLTLSASALPRSLSCFFPIMISFTSLCFLSILSAASFVNYAIALDASACGPGTFFASSKCKKCPRGTYQPLNASTSCIPCPPGTFNEFTGAQGIDLCEPCKPDTFNRARGSKSRSKCKQCPPGTASVSGSTKCLTCPPGTFVSLQNGRPENYRRGYNFRCGLKQTSDFRLVPEPSCYAGNYPRKTVCKRCRSPSSVTTTTNARACGGCPRGFSPTLNNTACKPGVCPNAGVTCFPGKREVACKSFRVNDGTSLQYNACPPGLIGNTQRGATKCVPCPPGTYRLRLRMNCIRCRKTVVENGKRCEDVNPGAPCPDTFFRHADGHCVQCGRWQRLNLDKMICEECPVDEDSKGGNDDTCRPCPANSMRPPYSLTISTSIPRETGNVCECKPGAEPIAAGSNECRLCSPGTSSRGNGCRDCPTGRYAPKEGMSECLECLFDLVAPERGQTMCNSCPKRLVPNSIRGCVSASTNCPVGSQRIVDENNVITACR